MNKKSLITTTVFTALSIINAIVIIVLACTGIFAANAKTYFMLAVSLIIFWAPILFEIIFKIRFNFTVLLSFDIFVVCALHIGSIWDVYSLGFYFDKVVHFASGVIAALIAYSIFTASKNNSLSPLWTFILVFAVSMAIGGIWEIGEFTVDGIFGDNSQQYMGFTERMALMDTMTDLICDCAGAIVGSIGALMLLKRKTNNDL
ncbi:MAG: DUF2238 domain-containing protein [Candidatus Scatosoma sp.]